MHLNLPESALEHKVATKLRINEKIAYKFNMKKSLIIDNVAIAYYTQYYADKPLH